MCISFLPEGKSRALIYLHTFTSILLAIVYDSYLTFQKVFHRAELLLLLLLLLLFASQDGESLI